MEDNYQKSLRVLNRLVRKSIYKNAQTIAMFKSNSNQVNTNFMLSQHAISENKEIVWIDSINEKVQADLYLIPVDKFNENKEYETSVELKCSKPNMMGLGFEDNLVETEIETKFKIKILTDKRGL